MGRTIEDIIVSDVEKRKIPSKHYVYVIYVTWSDGSTNIIYRRYSRFFDFQSKLREMYPEEAGSVDPEKRIIPFLPGKKFFGRSHIREVAVKRLGPIADYCKQIVKLPRKLSQCKEVLEFFEMDLDDMNPQKGKKASMKAHKISTPKPLEIYIACTTYKKQEKGEVSLKIGMMVEVVEKTETGWWFVNADEEQGWVPSTCLEREDGEKEETTTRFKPGEEEQYLSTEEFKGEGPDELSMERGAVVEVIEKNLEGWWRVRYNGREGYVPATYLMKTEAFQVSKRNDQGRTSGEGPQIVRSLHEISNLLQDGQLQPVSVDIDDEFDDTYAEPEEEPIYTIHEISRILKENKKGDKETDRINENIRNMKSRSLKRGGSIRPPPRPDIKPQFGEKKASVKPALARVESLSVDYITIAEFSDVVGDGISFTSGQLVKVLEKSEEGWWYIQIGESEGWAPASYIEKANPAPVPSPAPSLVRPPPPPQQTKKSNPTRDSQEDLTNSNESNSSPRRISAVDGLKDALKAKLNKGKEPPVPPKKDFLDDSDNDQTEETDDRAPSAASKPALGKPGFQLLMKPGQNKSPNRNLLKSPPPPPSPTAKGNTSETNTAAAPKPAPPFKVKPNLGNKPTPPAKTVSNSDDNEDSSGKINVSGLAGALKARFESKEVEKPMPAPPQANLKPKLEQKPKPAPPNMTQKPKLDTKPRPPSSTQKPVLDRDSKQGLKPVLNKVEFPGANKGGPGLPGRPSGNKPTIPISTKPSWVKPDTDSTNKPSWAKHQDDSETKPAWAKRDSSNSTRPASHNSDNTTKPSWAKAKVNNASKPAWAKNDNDTNTKPAWAKPEVSKSTKPSWVKQDNESKTDNTSVGAGGAKVSDLASVLKSKFENKQKDNSDTGPSVTANVNKRPGPPPLPDTGNKPVNALKPKPPRPASPSNVSPTPGALSPRAGKKGLDPKKYSSRPLPPMPAKGAPQEEEVDENPVRTKPLPGLPKKPAGAVTKTTTITAGRNDTSESNDDARPMGVSGLANALKAKLGANRPDSNPAAPNSHSNKPLPGVPVKSKTESTTSNITDKQNNNNKTMSSDSLLNAIADYDAGSEGEMSLAIGQQYELLDKADGWWYVSSGSHEGWAPADYLEHVRDSKQSSFSKTVQNSSGPKRSVFRTCSDFTAENEGELSVPSGQEVTVLDNPEGGWWLVKYGSEEGWMPESYVEEIMV